MLSHDLKILFKFVKTHLVLIKLIHLFLVAKLMYYPAFYLKDENSSKESEIANHYSTSKYASNYHHHFITIVCIYILNNKATSGYSRRL